MLSISICSDQFQIKFKSNIAAQIQIHLFEKPNLQFNSNSKHTEKNWANQCKFGFSRH